MPRVRALWNGCKKNKEFQSDMKIADHEDEISLFTTHDEKVIWASFYYGWLVAKYQLDWESHI